MFQILLSRNQSGAQLPPRAGNHLQRPETGQCAAGFWGSHQAYRLRHVQGVVYGLMWFVMIPQCTLDKSTCTAADVSVYSPLRWSHSWWSFFSFFLLLSGGLETWRYDEHFLRYPQLHRPRNTQRRGLRWGLRHGGTYQKCYLILQLESVWGKTGFICTNALKLHYI